MSPTSTDRERKVALGRPRWRPECLRTGSSRGAARSIAIIATQVRTREDAGLWLCRARLLRAREVGNGRAIVNDEDLSHASSRLRATRNGSACNRRSLQLSAQMFAHSSGSLMTAGSRSSSSSSFSSSSASSSSSGLEAAPCCRWRWRNSNSPASWNPHGSVESCRPPEDVRTSTDGYILGHTAERTTSAVRDPRGNCGAITRRRRPVLVQRRRNK